MDGESELDYWQGKPGNPFAALQDSSRRGPSSLHAKRAFHCGMFSDFMTCLGEPLTAHRCARARVLRAPALPAHSLF